VNKFRLLGFVILILLLVLIGSVQAQDATEEPTPAPEATVIATVVVEQPPVVVVDSNPSEDHLTLRELGLYGLVAVVVIVLGIVLYRLVTMVGMSYPPGTSEALVRFRERADQYVKSSTTPIDDLMLYLADPLVQSAIQSVKDREKSTSTDGNAVG